VAVEREPMPGSHSRELLAGSSGRLVVAVVTLLGATVVLVGAATAIGVFGMPQVVAIDNHLVGANETTTKVQSRLVVSNPNPFPITMRRADVAHTVFMNGIPVGGGQASGVSLGQGNSSVDVRTGLENERIDEWWVTHVRRGERTNLTVDATVESGRLDRSVTRHVADRTVRTDIISTFNRSETIPVNASRAVVSDPVLYVNETTAHWGNVTTNRTVIHTRLRVYNPKTYAVPITGVRYDVGMNDVAVANGSTRNISAIPPRSRRNVTARLVVDNSRLDEWWVAHVERNQTTAVRVDYAVSLDLSAYGGQNRTVSPEPIERTVRTDVFGTDGGETKLQFS
jgi:LEA14-like dessication related protein